MVNREEITARVEKIYEDKRLENMKLRDKRLAEVSEKIPRYGEIEKEISGSGFKLVSLAAGGRKDSAAYRETEEKLAALSKSGADVLAAAGFPADYIDGCFSCKKCRDTGRTPGENGTPVYCDCYRQYRNGIMLEESGLPVKKGFEAFDAGVFAEKDRAEAKRLFDDANDLVSNFKDARNRLFFGKAGLGKTYLASIVATELIRKGVFAVYTTVPMLMQTLLYFGDDERLQERRDRTFETVHSADFLVLDELGTERLTPARQDLLEAVIDGIVADPGRKCIVISNLDPKEMLDAYGERMFSRLASMKIVKFDLPATGDLRMKI